MVVGVPCLHDSVVEDTPHRNKYNRNKYSSSSSSHIEPTTIMFLQELLVSLETTFQQVNTPNNNNNIVIAITILIMHTMEVPS